jgi:DNA-binding transcriptional ArsR family regulator
MSASALERALGREEQGLHYHLTELVEAGLLHNYKEDARAEDGTLSYYELSPWGEQFTAMLEKTIRNDAELAGRFVPE